MKKIKVHEEFTFSWYPDGMGMHVYSEDEKTEYGTFALGDKFRGGYFLMDRLVRAGAKLGQKVKVTMEIVK